MRSVFIGEARLSILTTFSLPGYPQPLTCTVLINAFGHSRQYTGSTSLDEAVFVVGFDQNGFGQAKE